jgi:hypothetical protein
VTAPELTPVTVGARYVPVAAEAPPTLFVVVDTEEEFDWGAPFSRASTSCRAMRSVHRVQEVLDRYRVRPTYVIDYPVATGPDGYEPLLDIQRDGRCAVGAHLHPWVNPPADEPISGANSFACNLVPALEREKIERLRDAIGERFGAPRVYKAGRYGLGHASIVSLRALGFDIDVSINPHWDYGVYGGPSFAAFDARPFWFGGGAPLLEVPCTTAYAGWAGGLAPSLHRAALTPSLERLRAVGILNRLGAASRIMLSPEGSTLDEMVRVTDTLLARGVRTLSMTFHSPSAAVGYTPYVRTERELEAFLGRIDGYLQHFFGRHQGTTATVEEFRDRLEPDGQSAPSRTRPVAQSPKSKA